MRAKMILVAMCVVGLTFTSLTGCGQAKEGTSETCHIETVSSVNVLEYARQQGYNQAYLEIVYGTLVGDKISEESYNQYIKAKNEYEEDMTAEHFETLVTATQTALMELH